MEMPVNHLGEPVVGLESAPLKLRFPVLPEAQCAALVGVVPEVTEGLLEQVCLLELGAGGQDVIEGLPGMSSEAGSACQQYELLAGEGLLETAQALA